MVSLEAYNLNSPDVLSRSSSANPVGVVASFNHSYGGKYKVAKNVNAANALILVNPDGNWYSDRKIIVGLDNKYPGVDLFERIRFHHPEIKTIVSAKSLQKSDMKGVDNVTVSSNKDLDDIVKRYSRVKFRDRVKRKSLVEKSILKDYNRLGKVDGYVDDSVSLLMDEDMQPSKIESMVSEYVFGRPRIVKKEFVSTLKRLISKYQMEASEKGYVGNDAKLYVSSNIDREIDILNKRSGAYCDRSVMKNIISKCCAGKSNSEKNQISSVARSLISKYKVQASQKGIVGREAEDYISSKVEKKLEDKYGVDEGEGEKSSNNTKSKESKGKKGKSKGGKSSSKGKNA